MTAFREAVGGRTPWIGLLCMAAYWPVVQFTSTTVQTEWLHAVRITIGTAVIVAYFPGVMRALRAPVPAHSHQLVLGIVMAWAGAVGNGVWLLLWRLAGQPTWMVNSDINGFWLWMQILGGVLHITAPRIIDGDIPRPNWTRLWVAFGAGITLGGVIVAYRPDLSLLADALKPYLADAPP